MRYAGCSGFPLMAEQKPCVKCGRSIDSLARNCVYCNWDQELPPPSAAETAAAPVYIPPKEHRGRNRILAVLAFVALIVGAFFVGSMLHGFEPKDVKADAAQQTATSATGTGKPMQAHRSDVTLVPVEGGGGAQPTDYHVAMTSVPIAATATNATSTAEPADATALPSQQYAAAAARAQAAKQSSRPVDPRSVRGDLAQRSAPPAGTGGVRPKNAQRAPSMAVAQAATSPHTEPVAIYQPVPRIRVDRDSTARLYLTIGDDGNVRDIEVVQSVPGEMPKLIAAVQNWRFRPAMQDGQPVTASFTVNITFHANQ